MKLGVILGSSFIRSSAFENFNSHSITTDYGNVQLLEGVIGEVPITIIRRHQFDINKSYVPPHEINYKAMIAAFKQIGCDKIIGFYSVGSLKESIPLSSIIVPDDYAYLGCPPFFHSDHSCHFVPSLDEEMRQSVIQILKEDGFNPVCEGTYLQTVGPRFETKAEIRLYKDYFEIVGMTGASEATLSQELGIPFCMVGIIDNMCHGLGAPLSIESFNALQDKNSQKFENVINVILMNLCGCLHVCMNNKVV